MNQKHVVSVFGGASPQPGSRAFAEAEALGRALAQEGYAVATGGYVGTMEAVSKGAAQAGGHVIGATCEQIERWRGVRPNPWITEQQHFQSLHERVLALIRLGDALLALPGGLGTLSEIALAWSLLQTGEISPRPLVLIGKGWRRTFDAFIASADGYLSPADLRLLTFTADAEEALRLLRAHFRRPARAGLESSDKS